jgi:hypothetical protein
LFDGYQTEYIVQDAEEQQQQDDDASTGSRQKKQPPAIGTAVAGCQPFTVA